MGEVVGAVGPGKKITDASIHRRLRVVETDMAALKLAQDADRLAANQAAAATHTLLQDILDSVGKPQEGRTPATGIYFAIEAVSERVKPFEGLWLQVKGGVKTAAALSVPFGVVMWFVAGDKITALFHG